MLGRALGVSVLVASAAGCSDPIEGHWEGEDEVACGAGTVEHTTVIVEGDGTGYGDVCECDFTFAWTNLNDEIYRVDVDFDGVCLFFADGEYDCRIRTNGNLDCDQLGEYIAVD